MRGWGIYASPAALRGPYFLYFSTMSQEQAETSPSKKTKIKTKQKKNHLLIFGNQAACLGVLSAEGMCTAALTVSTIAKCSFLSDLYN